MATVQLHALTYQNFKVQGLNASPVCYEVVGRVYMSPRVCCKGIEINPESDLGDLHAFIVVCGLGWMDVSMSHGA
jgi:hypothetical protein